MKKTRYFMIYSIVFFVQLTACKRQENNVITTPVPITPTIMVEVESDKQVSITNPNQPEFSDDILIEANAILGEYHTLFGTSTKARKQNIIVASRKLDGTILYPGEEFSACKQLTPFTKENGYTLALGFANGRVVDSIGGGVCQVTTTLYNAVLEAELTILERHPHSMTVSYIELGRDAAIAENVKDFRFVNSMDTPVVIEAYTVDNYQLVVRIRGIEARDISKRSISFESNILAETEPGEPIIEYDKSQFKDYIKVTQSAHKGYRVELYKVIYTEGEETQRVKINSSEYVPVPQYMVVGIKE